MCGRAVRLVWMALTQSPLPDTPQLTALRTNLYSQLVQAKTLVVLHAHINRPVVVSTSRPFAVTVWGLSYKVVVNYYFLIRTLCFAKPNV